MRQAVIKYNNIVAGLLTESDNGAYQFLYNQEYVKNYPYQFITFKMPVSSRPYISNRLFPFFDGQIPEGWLLNIASKNSKLSLILHSFNQTSVNRAADESSYSAGKRGFGWYLK